MNFQYTREQVRDSVGMLVLTRFRIHFTGELQSLFATNRIPLYYDNSYWSPWELLEEKVQQEIDPNALSYLQGEVEDENGVVIRSKLITITPGEPFEFPDFLTKFSQQTSSNQMINELSDIVITYSFTPQIRAHLQGYSKFAKKTNFIVRINPPEDTVNEGKNCFAQWIVLGLSYLKKLKTFHSYRKFEKEKNRFELRKEFSTQFISQDYKELMKRVEQEYNVTFLLITEFMELQYMSEDNTKELVCGFISDSRNQEQHVDFVKDPSKFFLNRGIICFQCRTVNSKHHGLCKEKTWKGCKNSICHNCPDTCRACRRKECNEYENPFSCEQCWIRGAGIECKRIHIENCTIVRKGPVASSETRVVLKKNDENNQYEEEYVDVHIPQELKKSKTKQILYVYDIESYTNGENEHVPYLICCTKTIQVENTRDAGPIQNFYSAGSFIDYVLLERLNDKNGKSEHVYMAHNAAAFDTQLLFNEIINRRNNELYTLSVEIVQNGTKLMQLQVKLQHKKFQDRKNYSIFFRDSFCFLPGALRKLAKDYQVETQKDYFPHEYVTVEHVNPENRIPLLIEFDEFYRVVGYEGDRKTCEVEVWEPFCSRPLLTIAEEYCAKDVMALYQVIQKFEKMLRETEKFLKEQRNRDVYYNFLGSMTGPQMTFRVLKSIMNFDQVCHPIDTSIYMKKRLRDYYIHKKGFVLTDLDEYVLEKDNIYYLVEHCFFSECLKHGQTSIIRDNRIEYDRRMRVQNNRIFFNQVKHDTGKPIYYLRSCEEETVEHFKWENIHDQNEYTILPQLAYKGGLVVTLRKHVKGEIEAFDVCSEYPAAACGIQPRLFEPKGKSFFPKGTARNVKRINLDKEGLVKVKVYPPYQLRMPLLSLRVPIREPSGEFTKRPENYELVYPLCKACAYEKNGYCIHTLEERMFISTITYVEYREALKLGYTFEVLSALEYDEKDDSFMRDFFYSLVCLKQCSSKVGWEDKITQMLEYGFRLTESNFTDSPALKQVVKILMNAPTGKFGQKENQGRSVLYNLNNSQELEEYTKILSNSNFYELVDIPNIYGRGDFVQLKVRRRSGLNRDFQKNNFAIAAYITAYGRIACQSALNHPNSIYGDTDSAFFLKMNCPLYTGNKLGDWEQETEYKGATEMIAPAAKCYSVWNNEQLLKCKLKGVNLKKKALTKEQCLGILENQSFLVDQFKILTKVNGEKRRKVNCTNRKIVRATPDKRHHFKENNGNYNSIPYGTLLD